MEDAAARAIQRAWSRRRRQDVISYMPIPPQYHVELDQQQYNLRSLAKGRFTQIPHSFKPLDRLYVLAWVAAAFIGMPDEYAAYLHTYYPEINLTTDYTGWEFTIKQARDWLARCNLTNPDDLRYLAVYMAWVSAEVHQRIATRPALKAQLMKFEKLLQFRVKSTMTHAAKQTVRLCADLLKTKLVKNNLSRRDVYAYGIAWLYAVAQYAADNYLE